jgi:hypothetical protein
MKIKFLFFFIFFLPFEVEACDVCGCGMGGQYFGILPQFQRHFVGFRYIQRGFTSQHPALFSYDKPSVSDDQYDRFEIWGRWAVNPKLQIFGFLPYQMSTQVGSATQKVNGISDPWFMVNYMVINTGDSVEHSWRHALIVGAGAKLPFGKIHTASGESSTPTQLQPGTGSIDLPFHLGYTLRRNQVGVNLETNLRINTKNNQDYQFGHRLNSAVRFFYWKQWGNVSILPSAGLAYEWARTDKLKDIQVDMTGGDLWAMHVGFDFYYRSFIIQSQWQPALASHLGGGTVTPGSRFQIGTSILF